jgi:hypothetical protein
MPRTRRSRPLRDGLAAILYAAGLAALCWAVAAMLGTYARLATFASTDALPGIALPVLLYVSSHLIRVMRLVILAGDPTVSLRHIGLVHLMTAAVSIITPFKLGEAWRILELGRLLRSMGHALMIVWMERAFDFAVIAGIVLLAYVAEPSVLATIRPLVLVATVFVIVTACVFTIFPGGLGTLSLFVLRRYDGSGAVRTLRFLQWLREGIAMGPRIVAGKLAPLFVLTLAIWGLELATYWTILAEPETVARVAGRLATFLSSESLSGVVFHPDGVSDLYSAIVVGTLLAMGVTAGLVWLPSRLGLRRSPSETRRDEHHLHVH